MNTPTTPTPPSRACPNCGSRECGLICRFGTHGNYRHGHARPGKETRTYHSWRSMMMRCYYDKCDGYKYWGGRGISVCGAWHDFSNFLADMGEKPHGTTLDRINNDGDYTPKNCRWATPSEQSRNRRNAVYLEAKGDRLTIAEWAKRLGVDQHVIQKRLKRGWPADQAVSVPSRTYPGGRGERGKASTYAR